MADVGTARMIWHRFAAVAFSCLAIFGAARAENVGPQVDVTLRSGDSTKGQLLSYTDGTLTLKLENGNVVTQDGGGVVSLRFAPLGLPSAQETELTSGEFDRMMNYRRRELAPKNPVADRQARPLTRDESTDNARLRAKTELHIKALEAEIPLVATEEAAKAKLNDLARSQFLYGLAIVEIRQPLHTATLSIKNDDLRKKLNAGFQEFWN